VNPGVPTEHKYAEHLSLAVEERWIEPVKGEPDTYRRTHRPYRRSAYMRQELQVFKDKLIATLSGQEWRD